MKHLESLFINNNSNDDDDDDDTNFEHLQGACVMQTKCVWKLRKANWE